MLIDYNVLLAPRVWWQDTRPIMKTSSGDVTAECLLRTRKTFSESVMVSVGVSKLGCMHLIFIDPGVKINGAYYRDITRKL